MKLYYAPGACSLSPHIVAHEAGIKLDIEEVDLGAKKTKSGADYGKINPKGYVPALQLDSGEVLTEGVAIVTYLADQKPESNMLPKIGSLDRYRAQEWLTFISSEVHKGFSPLWSDATPDSYKKSTIDKLGQRFDYVEQRLAGKKYLMGDQFTAADAYLFTILGWTKYKDISLDKWPNLRGYVARVAARPGAHAAMKAEGLVQ